MKKRIVAILLSVSMMFLISCESQPQYSTENTYVAGQDFQYQFYKAISTILGPLSIAETEDGYYFLSGNCFLYYADKETMEAVLLCSRPDCLHDQEPKEQQRLECNAYFPGTATLFFTDGSLYIPCEKKDYNVSDPSRAPKHLVKVSADGTSREPLFDLYSEKCLRFHRGMLYYLDSPDADKGGEGNMALFRRKLEKDSEPEQMARFRVTEGPELTLYGNNAYVQLNSAILWVDLETGEENTIVEENSVLIGFRQDKLVYKVINVKDNGDYDYHYYISELDGSNPSLLPQMDGREYLQVDDQYYYDIDVDFWSEKAKPVEERSVRVLKEDGTLVSEFKIGEEGGVLAMVSDKYVFTIKISDGCIWKMDYAEKSGIETGQMEWKAVVYENAVESDGVTYTG